MPVSKKRSCILLASSASYTRYSEYVAWQIRQAGVKDIPIFIASADATPSELRGQSACIMPIEVSRFISKLPRSERLKEFGYWRIPGIAQAAKTYDRILYLDSDIHVEGSNLEKLLSIDMQGAPIAAVRDVHQSVRPNREVTEFKKLGWHNAPYFNAGVILIDGAKFLKYNALSMIENCAQKYPQALTTYDQSLLNIAYYKDWLELSPVWNWQLSHRNFQLYPSFDVELMHVAGETKPWSEISGYIPNNIVMKYREFIGDYRKRTVRERRAIKDFKYFLKNQWYLKNYRNWIERFESKFAGILVKDLSD